ncbi:hypothetical protein CDAR_53961 [Caerostris darwini]|uniref:Ribosomal protein L20 n=1 Tax=Caerostris darwini TaxID=1538125 RepID=A0AAV4WFJ8_9ARAC|nr:hypothetical protein CDAR_53961 [Caerostris darwini]
MGPNRSARRNRSLVKQYRRTAKFTIPVNGNENNLLSQSRGGIRNRDYFRLFWVSCSNDLMVRKSEKLGIKFAQKHSELSEGIISLESSLEWIF